MGKLFTTLLVLFLATGAFAQTIENQQVFADDDVIKADMFGISVSFSGDYAMIGARQWWLDPSIGSNDHPGKVYVFHKTDNTWSQTQIIENPNPSPGGPPNQSLGDFGNSVSMVGDYVVVGDYSDDPGRVYIYKLNNGIWELHTELTAAQQEPYFGISVSMYGDYVVVGQKGKYGPGSAYIFYKNQGGADNWGEVKRIAASDVQVSDNFGIAVCIYQDYVIVGADHNDDNFTDAGSAYIFYKDHGGVDNWGEVTKILATDPAETGLFGRAVAISENYAVVGAYKYESGDKGSAYVFYKDEGGVDNWGALTKLHRNDPVLEYSFGKSISISGDNVLVGQAPGTILGTFNGAAYLFGKNEGGQNAWGQTNKYIASDGDVGDGFGYSVCLIGEDMIIGTPFNDINGEEDNGAAYVFGPQLVPFCAENPIPEDGATEVTVTTTILSWEAVNLATSYDVYFGDIELELLGNFSGINCPVPGLQYNTQYYWRVVPKNDEGSAVNCSLWDFTTQEVVNVNSFSKHKGFSIFSNPSSGIFSIQNPTVSNTAHPGLLCLDITDITGKTIYTMAHKGSSPLVCPLQIDISNQPKGIYFLTIKTETGVYTGKLIINSSL